MVRSAIADALERLPSQPLTTVRILELVEDETCTAMDLARLIEVDPALSTRVLRMVNSPYYGLDYRVVSARRAVVMLGFVTVRALAVSGAASLLMDGNSLTDDDFWPHAVSTAAAAAHISKLVGASHGDAFTAGLLHDLGRAVVDLVDTDGGHAEAGAAALEHWRFPAELVEAVASHHDLSAARGERLSLVVHAAAGIAGLLSPQHAEEEPDAVPALELLGLGRSDIPQILETVTTDIDELAGLVGILG